MATGLRYGRKGTAFDNHDGISSETTTFYRMLQDAGVWTMTSGKDDLAIKGPDGSWRAEELGFKRFMRSKGKNDAAKYHPLSDNYTVFLNSSGQWESYRDTMTSSCTWYQYGCPAPLALPQDLYVDDYTAEWAMRLLEEAPEGQPFFLQVNYPGPHPPFIITEKMNASLLQDDRSWPLAVNSEGLDAEVQQLIRSHYASEIENIDALNGRILDTLEAKGVLNHTVVCLLSDHGEALGDHWGTALWEPLGKESPYQGSVRVPLACMGPGVVEGRVVETPVATLDLAATALELQGVAVPDDMDARSLRAMLLGAAPEDRPVSSSLATESGSHFFSTVLHRLDGHIYKLMCCRGACPEGAHRRPGTAAPRGPAMVHRLFDLTADPEELVDRSPERPDLVAQLAEMLPDAFKGCRELDAEATAAYERRMQDEYQRSLWDIMKFKAAQGVTVHLPKPGPPGGA